MRRVATWSETASSEPAADELCKDCKELLPLNDAGDACVPHACCLCLDQRRLVGPDGMTRLCRCVWGDQPPAAIQLRLDGIPAHHLTATLDALPEPMRTTLQLWASTWPPAERHMMLFRGDVGSGKTYAACAVGRAVYERHGQRCVFHTGPGLLARLRATQSDERTESERDVLSGLRLAPLLILDDLGKERGTGFAHEMLFDVVNERWAEEKATIVTGNPADITTLPDALLSRIASGLNITFTGRDRRLKR